MITFKVNIKIMCNLFCLFFFFLEKGVSNGSDYMHISSANLESSRDTAPIAYIETFPE